MAEVTRHLNVVINGVDHYLEGDEVTVWCGIMACINEMRTTDIEMVSMRMEYEVGSWIELRRIGTTFEIEDNAGNLETFNQQTFNTMNNCCKKTQVRKTCATCGW